MKLFCIQYILTSKNNVDKYKNSSVNNVDNTKFINFFPQPSVLILFVPDFSKLK